MIEGPWDERLREAIAIQKQSVSIMTDSKPGRHCRYLEMRSRCIRSHARIIHRRHTTARVQGRRVGNKKPPRTGYHTETAQRSMQNSWQCWMGCGAYDTAKIYLYYPHASSDLLQGINAVLSSTSYIISKERSHRLQADSFGGIEPAF